MSLQHGSKSSTVIIISYEFYKWSEQTAVYVLISPADSFHFNIKNVETDKFHYLHDNIQYALG